MNSSPSAILRSSNQFESKDVTLSQHDRLALLKYQIASEINKNNGHHEALKHHSDVSDSLENIEYVDTANQPITPINENDERKKDGKFHLRQLKTTTETIWTRPKPTTIKKKSAKVRTERVTEKVVADDLKSSSEEKKPKLHGIDKILNNKEKPKLRQEKLYAIDSQATNNIFYRRIYEANLNKHCSKETIHCVDMLTPILTGQKVNVTHRHILTYKDHEVIRLLQLLNEDTTDLTKDDIYSNLYQISNLQIRLFQWDIPALKMLFNVISKAKLKRHSWRTLKNGLKRLLSSWHMDFSNVTNLMLQTRIFRPPCIANNHGGSTKSSAAVRYTKKQKPKCSEMNEDMSGSCELT